VDPTGREAKDVMNKVLSFLTIGGSGLNTLLNSEVV
jgi:hypothetical protein